MLSAILFARITPSIPPAPPRTCPVAPFVEDMMSLHLNHPKTSFIAAVSFLSLRPVDVPCAFI